MIKYHKITFNDGRTLRVRRTGTGYIIRMGCSNCGHGLLINNGSDFGICMWENKQFQLNNDFLTELRNKMESQ